MNRKTGESENTDFDDLDWCVACNIIVCHQVRKRTKETAEQGTNRQHEQNMFRNPPSQK